MLKVILDTSVFVAAFGSKTNSSPVKILDSWVDGEFALVMSPQLLEELVAKLSQRGVSEQTLVVLVAKIAAIALHIPGSYQATRLDEIDPDDNKFLAAAYEAKADYLVSVDNHLLSLKYYHGTQIVTPALFLRYLQENL
ncbi:MULTISPECIES: putative toxin-antitoxin system toxin component, PIN family [Planktothricoides]|uniref:Toxin-antitoxin system toxin component, PIN family n=2 Tax=Planktothricoides raciborskii TaxID=132608 RepID=A0AAU8JLX4_9CYAN|nr:MULTISPECIES: putative toxin-antitoxin system toxin component, PIN family [Planktothricoides]KOR36609.1 twitching motility protein PilT [Planktothricoides sp. SR001]MBD2546035.1 putative toxin-antitoxin system toxin component, PIN family [Planktothricoides raciborskii FACHB-1370]MBD2584293.1 putative toxin-antitoxin system toxin component, PIN family [Planktothricoides raciborskii FACHB-1261]